MKFLKLAFCCIFFVSAASPHQSFTSIDPFWNFFDTYTYDEALHPTETTACKAALGSPGWPSDEDWANYNLSIGGRLIKTSPPGAVVRKSPMQGMAGRTVMESSKSYNRRPGSEKLTSPSSATKTSQPTIPVDAKRYSQDGLPRSFTRTIRSLSWQINTQTIPAFLFQDIHVALKDTRPSS